MSGLDIELALRVNQRRILESNSPTENYDQLSDVSLNISETHNQITEDEFRSLEKSFSQFTRWICIWPFLSLIVVSGLYIIRISTTDSPLTTAILYVMFTLLWIPIITIPSFAIFIGFFTSSKKLLGSIFTCMDPDNIPNYQALDTNKLEVDQLKIEKRAVSYCNGFSGIVLLIYLLVFIGYILINNISNNVSIETNATHYLQIVKVKVKSVS
jgi:hypothetical protein